MRAALVLLVVFALIASSTAVSTVHGQNCSSLSGYYVASLNADIDPGSADFLSSAVSNARAQCAAHFVFVLTTNGGGGGSMESMVGSIGTFQGTGGTFTTLVAPSGSFSFSAGAYIAEASDKIYMVPGTTIGSATPIVSGIPTGEENSTLTKDINAFRSYMETLTGSHGRNATNAGLMVSRGVSYACASLSNCAAKRAGVIDGVLNATSLSSALALLSVPPSAPVDTPGIRSQLISVFSDPNVSGLLFLVGVFAVLADIYHPTLILSIVGVVIVALALFGLGVFGASPLAIFLMVVGSAFIFLEVKTQHGISALAGVVIFIVGFLFIFRFPPSSPSNPTLPGVSFAPIPDITYGLIVGLGALIVIASLYLRSIREGLRNRPRVNEPSVLVGREGVMLSDLKPGERGIASVASEEWSVTSSQELKRGEAVRVKGVSGNTLSVEKVAS